MASGGGFIAANGELLRAALLESNVRDDGRNVRESRGVSLELSHGFQEVARPNDGVGGKQVVTTASVQVGRTRVSSTVSAAVDEPPIDRAHEGTLTIFVDCERDLVEAAGTQATHSEVTGEVARSLDQVLKHCRAVDLESLCIVPGRHAWAIRVDIRVLELDGNVLDAATIAAVASIKAFKRPEIKFRESEGSTERVTVVPLEERDGVRLTVHHTPFTVSFVAFRKQHKQGDWPDEGDKDAEGGEDLEMDEGSSSEEEAEDMRANFVYAIDATLAEEAICDAKVVVAADSEGYVRLVRKYGGCPLPKGDLTLLGRLACIRARELGAYVEAKCKAFDLEEKQNRIRRKANAGPSLALAGGKETREHARRQVLATPGKLGEVVEVVEFGLEGDLGLDSEDEDVGTTNGEGFEAGAGTGGGAVVIGVQAPTSSRPSSEKMRGVVVPSGKPRGGEAGKDNSGGSSPKRLRDAFTPEFLRRS
ncbi:exosome complex exoribonuclease [Chloropicon primus]|uniref:Exosome complex exoribonuclease n=2 Tax=Chloropicon primus TaxID=1764295 RepID=A0A5B8MX35_9CHLO|nr:exosome complex exoribonuclease [Chloropicon primus]UPR04266.1 exosome complex exoribonuclease [Chloropicon primus]|eukprot:QDZ25057.1 exosome complex exoribonuclease [Chloropicon primus]